MSWFGTRQKQSLVVLLLLIAGLVYFSLREGDTSPEAQVARVVRELVVAVEKKELAPFKRHLSEEVRDKRNRDKTAILNTLRVIYLRYPTISLNIVSLDAQDSTNPDLMSASLTLLMGESFVPSDKGNFNLTFRNEDGDWRIWEVDWEAGASYGY